MRTLSTTLKVLTCAIFIAALSSLAQAQATRTWVSGVGDDVNPCSRTAPCKTFAGAISKTAAGGEINVLDPGGFGAVTINKDLTIDGGGTFASILVGGTNAVNVNDSTSATPNQAIVTLRNLSINGAGATLGTNGVNFTSGKIVNIENCQIFNFSTRGVNTQLAASGGNVNIKNTSIFRTVTGVRGTTTVGFVSIVVDSSKVENNTTGGVMMESGGFATVRNSLITFNGIGTRVSGAGNAINLIGNVIAHNTTGVSVDIGELATLGSNTVLSNNTNFSNSGTIQTWGNNQTDTNPIPGVVTVLGLR